MSSNAYKFEIPRQHKSIIKVIGVGGGGSNAVTHMHNQGIKDVEFVVCNTDSQALKSSTVNTKLQIGAHLTEGLGAGANPDVGKNAALESKEDIRDLLEDDTKMVFITAGMGGGTGTGAAPVIAKIAKDLDVLTVGIVTVPFSFEGRKKMEQAQKGINEMKENCDTVLVILNDKLREIYGNLAIGSAFSQADNILTTAAKSIAEIITVAGYVNVDFQDVRTVMRNAGAAVMGSAETNGEDRARRAAEAALASPLLDNRDIIGAEKILLSIMSGDQEELQMDELTEITEYIQQQAGDDAEMIFGHGVDPSLEDKIRVTVIATGFDKEEAKAVRQQHPERRVFDLDKASQIDMFENDNSVNNQGNDEIIKKENSRFKPPEQQQRSYSFAPRVETSGHEDENDLFGIDDDFDPNAGQHNEQPRDPEDMMELKSTRNRLEKQAEERLNKLKGKNKSDMNTYEFKERLEVPAYLRKDVKLQHVPHSSEPHISRFNLNDDNQILGNNRYLHDNVD
jgi:cell division protein FtsZ